MKSLPLCPVIEPLEARIAPASVLTLLDNDGDRITITISSGTLTSANVILAPGGIAEINLDSLAFNGASLSVKVKAVPGGDGLVNIGAINASAAFPPVSGAPVVTVDLKSITVQGDVGRVAVGTGIGAKAGLGSLTVQSLGVDAGGSGGGFGVQLAGDFTETSIAGNLGKLTVLGDIHTASIFISGNLGATTIGGSLIGGYALSSGLIATASPGPTGAATAQGDAGPIKIAGSIIGGHEENTGSFIIPGNLVSLTVGGDLVGGTGDQVNGHAGGAGTVLVGGTVGIGAVKIGGSILGNSLAVNPVASGGNFTPFFDCGSIRAVGGSIASLTVGGSIVGGAGLFGGYVQAEIAIGSVKVGGDIRGDTSQADGYNGVNLLGFNGGVQSRGSMGPVTVGGSLIGGHGNYSGVIFVGNEDLNIPNAPIPTNAPAIVPGVNGFTYSADISGRPASQPFFAPFGSGSMGPVKILGSVIGGSFPATGSLAQAATGWIKSEGPMGAVSIGRDIVGGSGQYSGAIQSHTSIAALKVLGSIVGGHGFSSGAAFSGAPEIFDNASGNPVLGRSAGIGAVTLGGSLVAGQGNIAGALYDDTFIKSVSIGGDLAGDRGSLTGTTTTPGGAIFSFGGLGSIMVKGSIVGGITPGFGNIAAFGGSIGAITVGHDIVASTNAFRLPTTGIFSALNIGPIKVGGSISGTYSDGGEVFILADGNIAGITVQGRVQAVEIMAGSTAFNNHGSPLHTRSNPDSFIGPVKVGGDWIASNLVAGVASDGAGGPVFASPGNALTDEGLATPALNNNGIASRIASITIGGRLYGTPADGGNDGFLFAAESIGSLKVHGVAYPPIFLAPSATPALLSPAGDRDVGIFVLGGN